MHDTGENACYRLRNRSGNQLHNYDIYWYLWLDYLPLIIMYEIHQKLEVNVKTSYLAINTKLRASWAFVDFPISTLNIPENILEIGNLQDT